MLMENEEIKDYMVKKSVGIATKSFAKILVASVAPLVAIPPTVAGIVAEIAVKKSQEKKNDYKNKSYKRPFSKD